MWGIGCFNPAMSFYGPSFPFMGGMWGCSSMFLGPSMFMSPFNMVSGMAGSMIGSGLGGTLGYLAFGGMSNPWMGMTGMMMGSMFGSSLGWLAGSFGW